MTGLAAPGSTAVTGPRPRWGLVELVLALPFVAVTTGAGFLLGLTVRAAVGGGEGAAGDLPVLVLSWYGLQLGLGGWPLIVSWWRGHGPTVDWGLRVRPIDLGLGLGAAISAIGLGGLVATVVAVLVGLEEGVEVSNLNPVEEAQGTAWLYLLVAVVAVVGPLAEELFFRGLLLQVVRSQAGTVAGVAVSTVLFAAAHYNGSPPAELAILLAVVGTAGLVFAVFTVETGRLGPAMVGHMLFNAVAVGVALS